MGGRGGSVASDGDDEFDEDEDDGGVVVGLVSLVDEQAVRVVAATTMVSRARLAAPFHRRDGRPTVRGGR